MYKQGKHTTYENAQTGTELIRVREGMLNNNKKCLHLLVEDSERDGPTNLPEGEF